MSRAAVKEAFPRLASFLTTFSIGRNAAALQSQMVAQEVQAASALKLDTASRGKHLLSVLFQRKHVSLSSSVSPQLWQTGTETFRSQAAASEVAASSRLQTYWHHSHLSGRPAPITYGAVRQQHNNAVPHASSASTAQGAKKVHSESSGPKKVQGESNGGKQENNGGGAGRGFFSNLQDVPLIPLLLGFAGAIPFVALSPPVAPLLPLPVSAFKCWCCKALIVST